MWVGVLIGVVAGLLAIAVPLALILGVPLADAMRGGAGVIGALILAAATLFILPAALIGMVLFLVIEFLRDLGGVGSAAAGGDIGGDLPDVQDLLGSTATDGPALGVVALVIAIVVAFVVVRALVKRPGRSTVDGDILELREGRGSDRHPSPSTPAADPPASPRPAQRERGLRGEPRDPRAMARVDAPCLRNARRARAPDPRRSDRAADGAPGRRLRTRRIRQPDAAAVRAPSSDRALAAPSFDRRSAAGQDRSGEAARLTARAGKALEERARHLRGRGAGPGQQLVEEPEQRNELRRRALGQCRQGSPDRLTTVRPYHDAQPNV